MCNTLLKPFAIFMGLNMRFKEINPEVFLSSDPVMEVRQEDIEELKNRAQANLSRKARLCAHPTLEDDIHEMLIVHMKGAYVPPHKHPGKSESFHMIEGMLQVIIFDEEGEIQNVIDMSDIKGNGAMYYRLSADLFHTVIPRSEFIVFHETTNGPFSKADMKLSRWAPAQDDVEEANQYLLQLNNKIGKFLGARSDG
jgi:cupin fold WbuC family metalloprotein